MKKSKVLFNNNQGSVAIIVGLALVGVIIGILALTIDLGRTQTSYNKLQGATDAAAAAGAELWLKSIRDQISTSSDPFTIPVPGNISDYTKKIARQNFDNDQASAQFLDDATFQASGMPSGPVNHIHTYTVTVTACAHLNTALADTAKYTTNGMRTCTTSNAAFTLTELSNLEVAFALDFTNSMFWGGDPWPNCTPGIVNSGTRCPPYDQTKAYNLVAALDYTFGKYFPSGPDSTVWASIIPFSSIVNIYPYNQSMISDTVGVNLPAPKNVNDVIPPNVSCTTQGYPYCPSKTEGQDAGDSYRYYKNPPYYADYGMVKDPASPTPLENKYYETVLDRIPSLNAGTFNDIINDNSDYSGNTFKSYRSVINSLINQGVNGEVIRNECYNAALVAAFDQRIDQAEIKKTRITDSNELQGYIKVDPQVVKDDYSGVQKYTAYESFPIQPLTNNTSILENVIKRFDPTVREPLNGVPLPNNVIDQQTFPMTKSMDWSYRLQTSGIHGMLWAFLTLSNNWKDKWAAPSVHELYYNNAQSVTSRAGLPNNQHVKHIIFMTDGNDNDGAPNYCDAYAPAGAFSSATDSPPFKNYLALCDKIKAENIKIHVLLLDFASPDATAKFTACASPGEFYGGAGGAGVKPSQIKPIMDGIFKTIITDATTVELVK